MDPVGSATLDCPKCESDLVAEAGTNVMYCPICAGRFTVLRDESHGVGALVDLAEAERVHPLWLPRGSIRALVTLSLAGLAWAQAFQGRDIPPFLLGLLLALIGYYFGTRREVRGNESGIYDVDDVQERPLFLPPGSIRMLLIAGFLATAVYLLAVGGLPSRDYQEFFLILAGLVLGFIFRRRIARMDGLMAYNMVKHAKAIAVVLTTAALVYLVQLELHHTLYPLPMLLGSLVSFYFGSRA